MASAYLLDTFREMSRAICVAAVLGLAVSAGASPRTDPTTGRSVFTGATMAGAPSLELNPAAFGAGPADELYLGASATLDRYAITLAGQPAIRDVEMSPGGMLAAIWHLGDRFVIGLALASPPGERFVDGREPLRYHTLGGFHRVNHGVLAVEVKVSSRLFFGVSFAPQTSHLRLRYARDTALEMGSSDIGNPAAAERYDVNVDNGITNFKLIANFGVMVRLAKDTWLGLGYHAPPGLDVQSVLSGHMNVERAPDAGGGDVHGDATVYISNPASLDGELRTRLLPELDLHVGFRWEDLSRFRSYSVRGYGSTFAANGIPEWTEKPRGFQDPFALWAGVEQVGFADRWHFGGRIGFETAALPDERTSPMTVAPTSFTVDAGVQLRLPPIVLEAAYGFQLFPGVSANPSAFDPQARLDCIASGYDYSTAACESVRNGYAIPSAAGDYSRMEHALRFGLRYELP
jgi:hypothetical protein